MKYFLLKMIGAIIFATGGIWMFIALGRGPAIAIMLTLLGLAIQYIAREGERKKQAI